MRDDRSYGLRGLFVCSAILAGGGCAAFPQKEQSIASLDPIGELVKASTQAPASKSPPPGEVEKPAADRLVYYKGVKGSLGRSDEDASLEGRSVSLEFVNAPAADVARALIAELLGQTVSVADGVNAVISLAAADPVPADKALAALEAVLAESNLALLRTDDGYLLTPIDQAANASASVNRTGTAIGYGVAFAPVRNVKPSEIVPLLEPFVSGRLTITPDDGRAAIILKGPQSDIASAIEAIETFDAPQLTDRIFGMFRLQYADVATLRTELLSVMDATSAGDGAPVDLLALPRLNSIFVTARTRETFDETRGWIERLDQPSGGDESRLRYYPVLNSSAETLADQLNAALGGGALAQGRANGDSVAPEDSPSAVQPTFRSRNPPGGFTESVGKTSIAVDSVNNALIIRATDHDYREIADLLARMDVPTPQVLIEATIAEVTLNDTLGYGVRWFFENAESRVSFPGFDPGGSDDNNSATSLPPFAAIVPGFNYSYAANNVSAALDLLSSVTDVTVLSAPSIMVLNNETAHLQVGDEVPIVTQQAQSTIDPDAPLVSTLQLRETGVILDVKPRINASDLVVLDITQEVSDVAQTVTSGIDSPTIRQRKFTSTVSVRNNGVVALGGLIREVYTDSTTGIPVLKDIPILGYAFKSRDITKRRTELVVFLTPRIIRTDDDAREAIKYIRREMTRLGVPKS